MTTTTQPTEIHADPDVPLVRVTRRFEAPPAKVFRAHTDPDLVVRWLGPRRHVMAIDRWNCVTGGAYRYVHRGGGAEFWFHGSFHEVRPPELIVQTFTFEGAPDDVALVRTVFHDLGDGGTRLATTTLVDSFEGRDRLLTSGMDVGVVEGHERLDEVLAR
jgi:uncharacterized protein YndB with AHSA1/START domain